MGTLFKCVSVQEVDQTKRLGLEHHVLISLGHMTEITRPELCGFVSFILLKTEKGDGHVRF